MPYAIKNRWTAETIYESQTATTVGEAAREALAAGKSLAGADLAGDPGRALEARYGTARAARRIFRASGAQVPHFFAGNEEALRDLRKRAAAEAAG